MKKKIMLLFMLVSAAGVQNISAYEYSQNYQTEIAFEMNHYIDSTMTKQSDIWIGKLDVCLSEKECVLGAYIKADIYRKFDFVHPPVGYQLMHESYEFQINSIVEDEPGYFNIIALGFNQISFGGYIDLRDIDNPKLELKDKKGRIIRNIGEKGLEIKKEYSPRLYLGYD